MVKRDGAEIRKERIQHLARAIHKALSEQNPLSLSLTVKTVGYDSGLTEAKIMEYLELLEGLGHFCIDRQKDTITKPGE